MVGSIPLSIKRIHERLGENVKKAYALAISAHAGQKRKSGEKYITHPLAVAELFFSEEEIRSAAPELADQIYGTSGEKKSEDVQ
ncbi:hypothetical protein COU80_01985 [Candidatus Peregrinibacteria bacterium CG10_big_fil_rev_8_21_14_0_10_55_24]|nr:MAG: hypothetical protein COU80_01985 [Candidatus Peregrinibacteria bacterium CG10_big_fil_rev_8_21_14_0_10_55_24]